ncbi:DNA-directed RNA polymerase I subunit 1 [Silene latifolia]|uniref:DNA-directed RNA polymerase I subunit 1 n=1 Tax=Silene latifolia TaxID=37657 RepID=UPI003D77667D
MGTEMGTETVESVRFGIYTDEEVHKLSVMKITNRELLTNVGQPQPDGLYDPSLGPFDDVSSCKTCGQRSFYCPGHCGHIDLIQLVYHPLLFNTLCRILQNTCFSCFHFRATREDVQLCVAKLNLIREGRIADSRALESLTSVDSDSDNESAGIQVGYKHEDQREWTSLQLTEAHLILYNFFKNRTSKCSCGAKNPAISKPVYGWLQVDAMSEASIRSNAMRGFKVDSEIAEDDYDKSASEVEDAENHNNGDVNSKKRQGKKNDKYSELLKPKNKRSFLPTEVKEILSHLWVEEAALCSFISDIQQHKLPSEKKSSFMMFFIKTLLVPPTKFRPPSKGGDSVMEHPQTILLQKILDSNKNLANAYQQDADRTKAWLRLQQSVNTLFDSKSAAGIGQKDMACGICQLLEKKEGMFRQKMMGKRVNFACRSVISPDPYLAVNEIGIPPVFALRLTYPERVTPWNMSDLRDAIANGPDVHPGATHYVDKMSTTKLPSNKKSRISISRKLPSSKGVLTQPGKSSRYEYEGKVVLRHLRNGDIVLVNRQPTLHKPSIIALKVRVLPGERTLRFHYANCDSFNADFDGDEINVHFPQDEISRSEAYNIVNANNQYIVPTRGDPKRALIQDHIVSAVLLTKRDTFLTWAEFSELLYASGVCSFGTPSLNTNSGKKISVLESEDIIRANPPAIIRPRRLWTGKQVITAILNHVTRGRLPFTVKKRAKIAREYFGKDESKKKNAEGLQKIDEVPKKKKKTKNMVEPIHNIDEDIVHVHKNELVQGVIDKEQFGKYGLVHTVQEMYGPSAAGNLLSVLSRVLTAYFQMHGFTCGVDDLLLIQTYDEQRKQLLQISENCGEEVHLQFIGREKQHLESSEMQIEIEKAIRRNGDSAVALLDGMMRSKLNTLNSAVTKLFPEGLNKPFRNNCLSLMTLSGAKGGTFNFQQISLLLGQQELEGKRVPRMVSGKTLPCFPAWDSSARAGGFISDRYLTGLRPQEFYFHCMAGREGLVDTAVKTSRSGYLQRCLIKNLECLKVHYDYTVRDADGSIVQFRYGEDGVDVHQKNYMQEFEALALNQLLIMSNNPLSQSDHSCVSKFIEEDNEVPNQLATKAEKFSTDHALDINCGLMRRKDRSNFLKLVRNKYYMSLAQPGEPVGVIAAQSVGEPSTQMTLNTFHHAGRGEMNVTLGIPRLQEILMTASVAIKTPTMTCPLLKTKGKDDAECLAAKLKRITVADVIEKLDVSLVPFTVDNNNICSIYKLQIKLYEPELYPSHTDITLEDCHSTLEDNFVEDLQNAMESHLLLLEKINVISSVSEKGSDETDGDISVSNRPDGGDDDDDDEGSGEGAEDLGLDAQKANRQATDEMDYEDNEEEEEEEEEEEKEEEEEEENKAKQEATDEVGDEEDDDEVEEEMSVAEDVGEVEQIEHENMKEDTKQVVQKTFSRSGSTRQNVKQASKKKKAERVEVCHLESEGVFFEVHFKLINEPHILLAQIAEKTAKKVYVKTAGKIEQCKVVELHLDDSDLGGIPMLKKGKESRLALQTAGLDFPAFWDMQDDLDVRFISSNDIHAMLNTYGVEAARATIITEIFTVFGHYGVSVDMRHLTLIADYMTHTGGYRPMSRSGGIADSTSTFSKMSYESASKFLTDAATFGLKDNLETPSARICLGLPAKVGTGCFDLMQQIVV